MSDDSDKRNEVTIYRHKTGMYDKEESSVTLKSINDSVDDLIKKAKESVKNV